MGSTAGLVFVQCTHCPEKQTSKQKAKKEFSLLCSLIADLCVKFKGETWSWGSFFRPPTCVVTSHTTHPARGRAFCLLRGDAGSVASSSTSASSHSFSSLPYLIISHSSRAVVFESCKDFVSAPFALFFPVDPMCLFHYIPIVTPAKRHFHFWCVIASLCYGHCHVSSGAVSFQDGWGLKRVGWLLPGSISSLEIREYPIHFPFWFSSCSVMDWMFASPPKHMFKP